MPGALNLRPLDEESAPIVLGQLETDEDEAKWVAEQISRLVKNGVAPSDIAVLHRFSAQSLLTEGALRQEGVSVRSQGGTRFFDQPHVKRAVMEIRGAAVANTGGLLLRVVDDVLFGLGYTDVKPEHQGAARSVWEDLRAIRELAEAFPSGKSLKEFSEDLVRRAQLHDEPSLASVTLATVHSAKGQEPVPGREQLPRHKRLFPAAQAVWQFNEQPSAHLDDSDGELLQLRNVFTGQGRRRHHGDHRGSAGERGSALCPAH
jgi:DNA helicase-2/ATP-dependent DNA helicase PcrA